MTASTESTHQVSIMILESGVKRLRQLDRQRLCWRCGCRHSAHIVGVEQGQSTMLESSSTDRRNSVGAGVDAPVVLACSVAPTVLTATSIFQYARDDGIGRLRGDGRTK